VCDTCRQEIQSASKWTVLAQPIGRDSFAVERATVDSSSPLISVLVDALKTLCREWPRAGWGSSYSFETGVESSLDSPDKVIVCARKLDKETTADALVFSLRAKLVRFGLEPMKVRSYCGYGYHHSVECLQRTAPKQGWVCSRPAGPGTFELCSQAGCGPRCYGCGD
jgi:hypothetical protein